MELQTTCAFYAESFAVKQSILTHETRLSEVK